MSRNFFGWLSPYPIFLSFNFTRLSPLFLFLLLVLDLAILLLKNSRLWFLLPIFLSLFRKPLFASLKLPDLIPHVSVMMSHNLSHYDDVRYCTIPQIASPTILLLSVTLPLYFLYFFIYLQKQNIKSVYSYAKVLILTTISSIFSTPALFSCVAVFTCSIA